MRNMLGVKKLDETKYFELLFSRLKRFLCPRRSNNMPEILDLGMTDEEYLHLVEQGLDWIIADTIRGQLSNASNMLDVT